LCVALARSASDKPKRHHDRKKRVFHFRKKKRPKKTSDRFLSLIMSYGVLREPLLLPCEPLLELPAPDDPEELPLLLGDELELPELCTPLLLLVLLFKLDPLDDEPDGSLMLLPRVLDEEVGVRPDEDVPAVPSSLPLQPTNNTAALAIANSFFIMVTFLLQTVSSTLQSLNG
jgi:hypothetical protein